MGQTMLVIAAFSMLSILALSINGTFLTAMATGLSAQAQLNALSMAQSLLDEVLARDFDEEVTGGVRAFANSDFTTTANFGSDGGGEAISGRDSSYQSKTRFDDVDDYHGYLRAVQDSVLGWFNISCAVSYARETYPDSLLTDRSHYKVVTVTVTHNNLPTREVTDSTGASYDVMIPVELKDIAVYRRYF
ncbi:MAG: hypothetical protein ACRDGA_01935 [Bacteroidota bacterium]